MHKLVIDTNVIVSALIGSAAPHKILHQLVATHKATVHLSPDIFEEYYTVMHRSKFSKLPDFKINSEFILANISRVSKKFNPNITIKAIKDLSDNKFLELAVFSKAHFIITGNSKDFTFNEFRGVKIISPQEYWSTYWETL